jgi:uncharacterized protein (DUF1697 family)
MANIVPGVPRRTAYAALLRGVNLGARNRVRMPELRALVEELGCTDVATYLQSGNVVLRSDRGAAALTKEVEQAIRGELGLDVAVVVRSRRQLERLVAGNPFVRPKAKENSLYVTFLAKKPDAKRARKLKEESFEPERFELAGENVYLFFPNGYGRSKLSNALLERRLDVAATTRNWRTVTALAELTAAA